MNKNLSSKLIGAVLYIILIAALAASLALSASAENGKYVVILDPGHGGVDGGTPAGARTEKEYNLILAEYLKAELEASGEFEVHLTRETDVYLKYLERALPIIEHNADLLISLHCNSNTATYVNGCDAYVSLVDTHGGNVLAGKILDAISAAVPIARGRVQYREDTGDSLGVYYWNAEKLWDMPAASWLGQKSDYYSMNTWPSKLGVSSIIIEHGYLSNASDSAVLESDDNLRAIAHAEAEAIIEFFTGHEHSYTAEKVVDFPSSCTLTGTKSYRCTICGAKKDTEPLPAAPDAHYYRCTESRDVTCTSDGYAKYICQISYNLNDKGYSCDVHYHTETTPATGHNYTVVENTPATHGSNGVKRSVCENCGDTITEIITGDAHNYNVISETEPTCTEAGSRTSLCSVCGYEKTEETAPLGHDFLAKETVSATSEEDGYIIYVCSRCGEENTEILPHCAHSYVESLVEADCDTDGELSSLCALCGYEKHEVIPALGHDFEVLSETPPACELDGVRSVSCRICGLTRDELIPCLGHTLVVTKETLTTTILTCSVCGYVTEEANEGGYVVIVAAVAAVIAALAVIGIVMLKKRSTNAENKRGNPAKAVKAEAKVGAPQKK